MLLWGITAVLCNGPAWRSTAFGPLPAVRQRSESALIRKSAVLQAAQRRPSRQKTERQEVRHEIHPDPSRRCAEPGSFARDRFGLGARQQARRRAALHPQLRRGTRRRHFALVAGRQRRQVDGLRRQLLPDQARPGLALVGHRRRRRDRRDAGRPGAVRSACDALATAEDARRPARAARASSRPTSSMSRSRTPIPTISAT